VFEHCLLSIAWSCISAVYQFVFYERSTYIFYLHVCAWCRWDHSMRTQKDEYYENSGFETWHASCVTYNPTGENCVCQSIYLELVSRWHTQHTQILAHTILLPQWVRVSQENRFFLGNRRRYSCHKSIRGLVRLEMFIVWIGRFRCLSTGLGDIQSCCWTITFENHVCS